MRKSLAKIAFFAALGLCFAQEAPPKLAVYTSGAGDANVNRLLSSKLLAAMSQGGAYAAVADPGSFQDELAKGKGDIAQISGTADRYGADYVCVVSIIEAFGAYSITARLLKVAGSQVAKTATADRALKSLDDLTAVSGELSRQLLPLAAAAVIPPAVAITTDPPAPPVDRVAAAKAAAREQCAQTYNINEILFNIKDGFPRQLKDCASKLAKDMLTPAAFGGKKLEPVSFMKQCPVDGIRNELPDGFPDADKLIGSVNNFVQSIMNTALAGASLDPKKLLSALGSMDINSLLSDVKKLKANACIVDEPYEPPDRQDYGEDEEDEEDEDGKSSVSFGIRVGMNFSHTYADIGYKSGAYDDILGMQAGFVLDIAATDWFHFQPGLMYIQKGMSDGFFHYTSHNLELPVLLSLKLAVLRLNAGPYVSVCLSGSKFSGCSDIDVGISTGLGFDIGMFYIGAFYDYGFFGAYDYVYGRYPIDSYNRTLGLNLGVNL